MPHQSHYSSLASLSCCLLGLRFAFNVRLIKNFCLSSQVFIISKILDLAPSNEQRYSDFDFPLCWQALSIGFSCFCSKRSDFWQQQISWMAQGQQPMTEYSLLAHGNFSYPFHLRFERLARLHCFTNLPDFIDSQFINSSQLHHVAATWEGQPSSDLSH